MMSLAESPYGELITRNSDGKDVVFSLATVFRDRCRFGQHLFSVTRKKNIMLLNLLRKKN